MNSAGDVRERQAGGCIGSDDFRAREELSDEKLITGGGEEVGKGRRLVVSDGKRGKVDSASGVVWVINSVGVCRCEDSSCESSGGSGKGEFGAKAVEFGG